MDVIVKQEDTTRQIIFASFKKMDVFVFIFIFVSE